MPTTTFIESGTDATQDLSFYAGTSTTNGTVTSDSTQSNDGPRSIKVDMTVSGGKAQFFTPNSVVADAGSLISMWVRFSSVTPATDTAITFISQSGNGTGILGIGISTTGKLRICGRGTTAVNGNTVLSANTWYRLSIGYIITSTTNWSAVLYLNGVSEASTSNADGTLLATGTSCVSFGIGTSGTVDNWGTSGVNTIWYDSIYIDNRTDKSDCGNVHVTAKRPNANGTSNQFTTQIGAGGSGYGSGHAPQVNEQPLSTTNGWSIQSASNQTEEYTIEAASVGDVDISAASIVDYMGWVYEKVGVNSTGNIIVGGVASNISVTTSYSMFTKAKGSTTYPSGSTDIGVDTNTVNQLFSLAECGILFAYIPVVASVRRLQNLSLLGIG